MDIITGANKQRSYSGDYMQRGIRAEQLVHDWLESRPDVKQVIDCRNNEGIQTLEVDFIAHLHNGQRISYEVKYDSSLGESPNILFEILRLNHTANPQFAGSLGWGFTAQADKLIFYAPKKHALYCVDTIAFRQKIQSHTQQFRQTVKTIWINTDNIKSTLVLLIPFKVVENIFTIYQLE